MRSCSAAVMTCALLAGAAAASNTAYKDTVASLGPILWYQFDEAPGATSIVNHGSLGAGFDGIFPNGLALGAGVPGGDGGAFFSHPQQQYVESLTAAPASLTGNPTFTAEAIVRTDAQAGNFGYPPFLHWGAPMTGKSVYFSLWANSFNRAYTGFYNGGLRMVGTYDTSKFHHFVWVREGGANGQWTGSTLYVDGIATALEPDTNLIGAPVIDVTSTTFRVQRATDNTRYFTGVVDEVVLYDKALTPGEVAELCLALGLPIAGDADGDKFVDSADLNVLLAGFGCTGGSCGAADIDGDGDVDSADLNIVLANFGKGCGG